MEIKKLVSDPLVDLKPLVKPTIEFQDNSTKQGTENDNTPKLRHFSPSSPFTFKYCDG